MEWLKGFFRNAEYSAQGSLIKLSNPEDNYTLKTVFMNGTLIVKNKELFIKNDDFDSEQEQSSYISFPLSTDTQVVHYSISDEETKIDCIKWVNLNSQSAHDSFYGFQFENSSDYTNFSGFVSKYIKIDEEGYQDPSNRIKNLKQAHDSLIVTTKIIASDIQKPQLKPEQVNEEEKVLKPSLEYKKTALECISHLYSPETILFMSPGNLYLIGPNLATPLLTDQGIGFMLIRHPNFIISLEIVREGKIVMRIVIDTQFYYKVDETNKTISWVENVNEFERRTWRAYLLDDASNLQGLINVAIYEAEKKTYVKDLAEEDQKWVTGEDSKSEVSNESESKMEIDFEESTPQVDEEDNEEIIDSAQSWRDSKVFAARKGKVTLYLNSENGLKKSSVIPLAVNPTHVLLQKQENNMLFLNKAKPNIVYNLDLSRCEIVEEYKLNETALKDICLPTKFSQLSGSDLFLGVTDKSIYTIDPRDPNKIVQDYTYSTNLALNCLSTTEQGHIAVGSEKGDIRLYKEVGKKSTTKFPGLGHPIKSIDVTKDGSWMVATTDTYLMVVQTKLEGELAYTKALLRKRKTPKKLTISPEDIAKYQILSLNFTPAKFNINESTEENAIISSTGKLIVIWNFSSIKSGNLSDYYIKPMTDNIIKNEFRFGEENALITYPKSVAIQNNKWSSRK